MRAPGLDGDHTVLAHGGRGTARGMVLKDHGGEAMDGSLRDYVHTDGPVSGPSRLGLLRFLGEGAPAATLIVDTLAVSAETRGRGAGGRLLAEAETNAAERGQPTLALDVLAGNLGTIHRYERSR